MIKRYVFSHDSEKELDIYPSLKEKRNKCSLHGMPFYIGLIFLVYLLALFEIVYIIDNNLPTPLTVLDEQKYPEHFIAERAVEDLETLTKIGPRITGGYENEQLSVAFLKEKISLINYQAHPNQKLELDVQLASGAYTLDLLHVDQINVYANVQNVVVKLHGSNDNDSILVNAHFDSVPTSPGGSDDGINVVAMLEILRKLSKSSNRLLHNVIFLFNGAEETVLQASHGFITQHKWAKQCRVILNLEACGSGGKIILFQTGPQTPWLMNYYNSVPHPYGQVAGEELFQTGLIPSDTDFRIFRDFGGLVGMDMAFFKNGYRYHTKYDNFQSIPHGSFQHVGDNALSLITNLAQATELLQPLPVPGKMVYFDFLGWFMVSYTNLSAVIFNLAIVGLSIGLFLYNIVDFHLGFSKTTFRYMMLTLCSILGSWILSLIFVLMVAYILDVFNKTMSWYANPVLLIGLYSIPATALSGCLLSFVNNKTLALNIRCQIQAHIMRQIWTTILFVGTLFNIRSMYVLLIPVSFNCVAFIIIELLHWKHTIMRWRIIYIGSLVVPTICLMYQGMITLAMFIPLTGRIGSNKNPEIIIGLMTVVLTIVIISPYVALINLLKNSKYFFVTLGLIFLACFAIIFTPFGFPYRGDFSSPAPQRYWLVHTTRLFHNEFLEVEKRDAGVFFLHFDRNSPNILKPYVKDIEKAKPVQEYCNKFILCGLPLSHAKMVQVMEHSTWIPANQPEIHKQLIFTLNSRQEISKTIIRYNVSVSGPDRLSIYLVPKSETKLADISLVDIRTVSGFPYKDRQLYFILYASGKDPTDLNFTFDIQIPVEHNGTIVDLVVTGTYVHPKEFVRTPFYSDLIKQFPDWADVTAWLGAYSSYVLL